MLTFEQAWQTLIDAAQPLTETQTVALDEAYNRVLAEDVVADINVPPRPVSTMDGYALCALDYAPGRRFEISQRVPAGSTPEPHKKGTAARIFTGAPVPDNAFVVIPQEEAEVHDDGTVSFTPPAVKPWQNIRRTGEDIAEGDVVVAAGTRLVPQHVGLIASLGIAQVRVLRRLKVATFTTGDELVMPGQPLEEGQIYNSNRFVLHGLLERLGVEVVDLGQVQDTLDATVAALKNAAQQADVVMTTGGVSVGEEDHLKPAVEQLGALDMWKVKMKPGKPLAYGRIGETPFIGLPGNPVSAFATFHLLAGFFLRAQAGERVSFPEPIWVRAGFSRNRANFRRDFARARLENRGQESFAVLFPNQGSGVLTSVAWASGFAVIPEDTTVEVGDAIAFYPFRRLLP
ncbi:molybdopterin molybdochelatase [Sulfurivirga caldicuralii]|uniref:Molybdopterin molybdenumtransferase n=1 Tax=Sulfurivirga caldicuralii TaxID=364032 RepID=A0A1N6H6B7_9GAMM|nr:gephyrin-like molybdotransferase Glp [Sulfurivirga caldicuralii]SIO15306.1 molybdopterin molybdochelatase [Sulfurivirga caldicuralii]